MRRREFLRLGTTMGLGAVASSSLWQQAFASNVQTPAVGGASPYGDLLPEDANDLMLPPGFTSRIIATSGQNVSGTSYSWHGFPDGGACFDVAGGGWVYTSNSEQGSGGAGAVRFDSSGNIIDAYSILSGTSQNCAGGPTPWGTWLSCEETSRGSVWECDPLGVAPAVERLAMGNFVHEAATADPLGQRFYMSEDSFFGGFYRFTPDTWGDLSSGLLEIAELDGEDVIWHEVPDPNPGPGDTSTSFQVSEAERFQRGEGIHYAFGRVYLCTTGDNKVWQYDPLSETMCVRYETSQDPQSQLSGVDNVTSTTQGHIVVAEDGGNMELVMIRGNKAFPIVRITYRSLSEICGPAFNSSNDRLYFSSQTGSSGDGITYEVSGNFT